MINFDPAIKWTGSKRSQMNDIVSRFPKKIDTYYEPFCGSCAVMRCMVESGIVPNKIICSDINSDLIELWKMIKDTPDMLISGYTEIWNNIVSIDSDEGKTEFFYQIRERYNNSHSPIDFMFLQRTSINGLIRYNRYGKYTSAFHHGRNGINPQRLKKIIIEWSEFLNKYNVEFICQSYDNISVNKEDFVYMDPPYTNIGSMYFGEIDMNKYFDWLRSLDCRYAISFNGKAGDDDKTFDMPKDIYVVHEYLKSGKSSFRKLVHNQDIVYESIYLNY